MESEQRQPEISPCNEKPPKDSSAKKSTGFPTKLIAEPQDKLSMDDLLAHLLHLEAKDVTLKWVFDHVRNYVICGAVMWAGLKGFKLPSTTFFDTFTRSIGGGALILSAFVLFALNMAHGVAGFSKIRNFGTLGKASYLGCSMLLFFAAQVLFVTTKSS